jgi:hypothetical protein
LLGEEIDLNTPMSKVRQFQKTNRMKKISKNLGVLALTAVLVLGSISPAAARFWGKEINTTNDYNQYCVTKSYYVLWVKVSSTTECSDPIF